MRLRTYLIRRAIHTVITLLVVLVLLFVIFRLMPGDPSRFFIAPGQPPQVRDEICVSFGLCKWVSAPGNGYEAQIRAGALGPYNVNATVTDAAANRATYHFVYNNLESLNSQDRSHPWVEILHLTLSAAGGPARASLPGGVVGDTVIVRAQVLVDQGIPVISLDIRKPDSTMQSYSAMGDPEPTFFTWTVVAGQAGFYSGIITAQNLTGSSANATFGFSVDPSLTGFDLVEDRFYGIRPTFPPNVAIISVNITSRVAPIASVVA